MKGSEQQAYVSNFDPLLYVVCGAYTFRQVCLFFCICDSVLKFMLQMVVRFCEFDGFLFFLSGKCLHRNS